MVGAKVLMCPYFSEKFHRENHEHIKEICHFYYHCDSVGHFFYVDSCKQHTFIAPREEWMEQERCMCAVKEKNEIYNFCVEVKYLLNFKAFKFCLKKVPENFQGHMVSLPDYPYAIFPNKPFF